MRELTIRGLVLGALITVIFTASNIYLGLKVGLTFASSIPAAVISMAVLRAWWTVLPEAPGTHAVLPLLTALGSLVWNAALVVAGYVLGEQWEDVGTYSDYLNYAVYAVLLVLVVRFVWTRTRRTRRGARDGSEA